jgi:hypothetical protein
MIAQSYVPHTPPEVPNGEGLYQYHKNLRQFVADEFSLVGRSLASGDMVMYAGIDVPASSMKQTSGGKPDFDYTNVGYLFPQNDTAEKTYFEVVLPTGWLAVAGKDASIYPRVAWDQAGASNAVFKLSYRFLEGGANSTAAFTTITSSAQSYTYTTGSITQIAEFPAISITSVGALRNGLACILYRDDNVVTGDVRVPWASFVVQLAAGGSRRLDLR